MNSHRQKCDSGKRNYSADNTAINAFATRWRKKFAEGSGNLEDSSFAEACSAFGFRMDTGISLKEAFPGVKVEMPEGIKAVIDSIEDVEFLGTAIFSYWRWRCKLEWGIIYNDETREWMLIALNRLIELTKS